jgi:hypothetical protein
MNNIARKLSLPVIVLAGFLVLVFIGSRHLAILDPFPDKKAILEILRMRDANSFWQQLSDITGRREISADLVYSVFSRFDEMADELSPDDRISIDAVRGVLLSFFHYDEHALVDLRHVVANSLSTVETRRSLLLMAEIYTRRKDHVLLQKTWEQLRETGEAFRNTLPETQQKALEQQKYRERLSIPYYIAVWFLLLIFPAAITEIERRNWMKKYATRSDLRGPFIAFAYSPMCIVLTAISAIVFLVVEIPSRLAIPWKYALLFFHVFFVWLLCQWPLYLLENTVKKGGSGPWRYCLERLRLVAGNNLELFAALITFMILHLMVAAMPMWPMLRPAGATVLPSSLFAVVLLLLQFLFPYLAMFEKAQSPAGQPVFSGGNGFRRGMIEIGAMFFNSVTLVFGGVDKSLDDDEYRLLLQRSRAKIEQGWLFQDFLLVLVFSMAISGFIALNPLAWTRFFVSGPGFFESFLVVATLLICSSARKNLARSAQEKVDLYIASYGNAERLIMILEKINSLNFFPESLREGDRNEFDHMSLDEARLSLRKAEGVYFPASSRPDCSVLVSLWRSRLAIDWKLGIEEAVFLASIDYAVSASGSSEELSALAARHARLGSECIVKSEKPELDVVYCCQKFSAFTAETPLPQKKICEICSGAMMKSLQFGPYSWNNTDKGCVLKKS